MHVLKPQPEDAVYQPSASTENPARVHFTISDTVIESHNEESMGFFNAANWTQHSCNSWHLPCTIVAEDHPSHNMILDDVLSVEDRSCASTVVRCALLFVYSAPHELHCICKKSNVR